MLNQNSSNSIPLNTGNIPTNIAQDDITINGFSLSNENIKTYAFEDNAQVNVSTSARPQSDGLIFLSNFKQGRNIKLGIYLKGSDVSDFQSRLDELRKNAFKENVFLDMKIDGVIRRVNVNCTSSPKVFNHYNITFLKLELNFQSTDPYWYLLSNQSTSIDGVSDSFQEEISTIGTAKSDINAYIIFTTSDSTQVKMEVGENEIIVDHAFDDGDILLIDGENKKVLVNDVEIDYSGIFPFLEVGTNFFNFTIDGTFVANVLILNRINYV